MLVGITTHTLRESYVRGFPHNAERKHADPRYSRIRLLYEKSRGLRGSCLANKILSATSPFAYLIFQYWMHGTLAFSGFGS